MKTLMHKNGNFELNSVLNRQPVEVFRLDALALSVIATATWLARWLGGCHTPVLYQNG